MIMTRRNFLRAMGLSSLGFAFSGVGSLVYASKIEPTWFDVEPVTLHLPRLQPEFDGYRIVQISDMHLDTGLGIEGLEEAVSVINDLQPDAIVLTGDYLTRPRNITFYRTSYPQTLSQLRAKDGVVGILGNHDHWGTPRTARSILEGAGIPELSNQVWTIQRGEAQLHICGVDDIWEGHPDLDAVLTDLPSDGAAILLAHEPDYADTSSATGRFDLQISGHTHGGQVNIPFWGPLKLPPFGEKYHTGLYRVGDMYQYTNRGLGTVEPPVRFNCRPEITAFTLKTV